MDREEAGLCARLAARYCCCICSLLASRLQQHALRHPSSDALNFSLSPCSRVCSKQGSVLLRDSWLLDADRLLWSQVQGRGEACDGDCRHLHVVLVCLGVGVANE